MPWRFESSPKHQGPYDSTNAFSGWSTNAIWIGSPLCKHWHGRSGCTGTSAGGHVKLVVQSGKEDRSQWYFATRQSYTLHVVDHHFPPKKKTGSGFPLEILRAIKKSLFPLRNTVAIPEPQSCFRKANSWAASASCCVDSIWLCAWLSSTWDGRSPGVGCKHGKAWNELSPNSFCKITYKK